MMPDQVLAYGVSVKDIMAWRLTSPEAMAGMSVPYKVPEVAKFLEVTEREARDGINRIEEIIGYYLVGAKDFKSTMYAIGLRGTVLVRIEESRAKRLGRHLREDPIDAGSIPSPLIGGVPSGNGSPSVIPRDSGGNGQRKPHDCVLPASGIPQAP
jgi:hypothetical protein